jgi:pSer/pThr/pTyr-binding forkhead associated (FHA) protein
MAKLIMYAEDGGVKEIALDRERITLGRRAHNDIYLDSLAVSGNHAVIITLGGDSFLEDLNSTNGTWVNQKPIQKCVLHDGDEIRIAGYRFNFSKDPSLLDVSPGARKAGKISRPSSIDHPAMDAATLMPAAATELRPPPSARPARSPTITGGAELEDARGKLGVIRILAGAGSGQTLKLTKQLTSLGKPGIQVAAITLRDGRYYLGLAEGDELPLVNDKPVVTLPYLLKDKDVINVAGVLLEFTLI